MNTLCQPKNGKKNEIEIKLLIVHVVVYLSCRLYICQYLILFSLKKNVFCSLFTAIYLSYQEFS